jgi:sulfane dehydrogenase subunit SoxC
LLQALVWARQAWRVQAALRRPPAMPKTSRPICPNGRAALAPACIEETYGTRSRHETAVRRYVPWLTPDRVSSISFTPLADMHGIITPSGLHFERHHGGVPDIEPVQIIG